MASGARKSVTRLARASPRGFASLPVPLFNAAIAATGRVAAPAAIAHALMSAPLKSSPLLGAQKQLIPAMRARRNMGDAVKMQQLTAVGALQRADPGHFASAVLDGVAGAFGELQIGERGLIGRGGEHVQQLRFDELHVEMEPAAQVFIAAACQIVTGVFEISAEIIAELVGLILTEFTLRHGLRLGSLEAASQAGEALVVVRL